MLSMARRYRSYSYLKTAYRRGIGMIAYLIKYTCRRRSWTLTLLRLKSRRWVMISSSRWLKTWVARYRRYRRRWSPHPRRHKYHCRRHSTGIFSQCYGDMFKYVILWLTIVRYVMKHLTILIWKRRGGGLWVCRYTYTPPETLQLKGFYI